LDIQFLESRNRLGYRVLPENSMIKIKPSHRGLLHRNLGVKKGKKIPLSKLMSAKHSDSPAERKRATFAINARSWHH
jgi:hypothetical protein